MQNFLICLYAIAPIFIIIGLGVLLKKVNIADDNFTDKASDLVFKVILPVSLFYDIVTGKAEGNFEPVLIVWAVVFTFALFGLGLLLSKTSIVRGAGSRAAVAQGIFRSNYAILGLPLTKAIFGDGAAVTASVILAVCIPLFNALAVVLIETSLNKKAGLKKTLVNVLKNPLIIGVLCGGIYKVSGLPLPVLFVKTLGYIDSMCMPLSFIVIGASMIFERVKEGFVPALIVSLIRTAIAPVILISVAYAFGVRGEGLGILFIFTGSPAAISGYIMMRKMGGDYDLAGNIVLISTFLSFFTILLGIWIMKNMGLV